MPSEPYCERCGGTGWIAKADSFDSIPCHCRGERRRRQRIEASGIPTRYRHCRLGVADLEPGESGFSDRGNGSLLRAKKRAEEFIDLWPKIDRGLLLMGSCGSGKTHLAVSILREIIEYDKSGKLAFANFQDLIQEIHASFDSSEVPRKSEILRPLLEADLLVLDELGSQKPTTFVQETLYYLINTRYNEERATIFTTNYLDRPPAREESLTERIGKTLRSRLYEMTESLLFEGVDDYRSARSRGRISLHPA